MKTWTENSRNFGWNQAKKKKCHGRKNKKIHVWNQVISSLKLFFLFEIWIKKIIICRRENLFLSWKCEKNFTLISFHVQNQMKK